MMEGYIWRQEQQRQHTAWWLAHLLNVSGKTLKSRITPSKLLGPKLRTREQRKAAFDAAWSEARGSTD